MKQDKIKSYCIRCDFDTNNEVIHKEQVRSDDENYDYVINYYLLKCLGCDNITYRRVFIDIESSYPDEYGNWHAEENVLTFPTKLKVNSEIENSDILPERINLIYEEAIKAYNADCPILTGVAFRAIIEAICLEEKIPGRNLENKINSLVKHKLITEKESNRLHSIRFIGNDSVHEMKVPKDESLKIVLNIIHNLLNNLYIIDYHSQGHLETVIDSFEKFTELILLNLNSIKEGDEVPLAKIFGKQVRRLNGKLNQFENELIDKINLKLYDKLSLGKKDTYGNSSTQVQHFIKN
jgi:hypothetical protein